MRTVSLLLATGLIGLSTELAMAQQKHFHHSTEELKELCDPNGTQQQMNACAAADFKEADSKMNELYTTQMSRLSEPSKTRLREAQKAWIQFRDKACAYEMPDQNGSMVGIYRLGCLTNHTNQRVDDLSGYVNCTQNGCPY